MRRWFAHPWLSLLIAACWLLLQQSVHPAHLVSGAVLALVIPRLLIGFLDDGTPAHGVAAALRLVAVVLWDIVISNLTVARLVLSPTARPQPAWVRMPLRLRQPTAINLLAAIITTTPGTVSCVVDPLGSVIWVHALDCDDPAALLATMQQRYEQPLMEIFG